MVSFPRGELQAEPGRGAVGAAKRPRLGDLEDFGHCLVKVSLAYPDDITGDRGDGTRCCRLICLVRGFMPLSPIRMNPDPITK
jgi:hypothetical protein